MNGNRNIALVSCVIALTVSTTTLVGEMGNLGPDSVPAFASTVAPFQCSASDSTPCLEPPTQHEPPASPCTGGCSGRIPLLGEGDISSVYLHSGEFFLAVEDLRIRGRGLDFVWARKYRSRAERATAMGYNWDFSYNIYLERRGNDMLLHDGNSRADLYLAQPDGSWSKPGVFRVLNQEGQNYTLHFAQRGVWRFRPLDGSPAQGRISRVEDLNENGLDFIYDGAGRLIEIHDTLGRSIIVAYNSDGFIESVTDFTGRQVVYTYYAANELRGSFGDLKTARSPIVVGTPTNNDFPNGTTTRYEYTPGFGDPALNHNLHRITDARGRTTVQNTYAHTLAAGDPRFTLDPSNINFDRIMLQMWGGSTADRIQLYYEGIQPTPGNGFLTQKITLNDRMGNVREYFFDQGNRGVFARQNTGRATPGQFTHIDSHINPPVNPLRPNDPEFFESRWEYNADSLVTRSIAPCGDEVQFSYDSANASPISRGNMLSRCRLPGSLGGTPNQICESFEYLEGAGGCCGTAFLTQHVDPLGHPTYHFYDKQGNRIKTDTLAASGIEHEWEYNQYGQIVKQIHPVNDGGVQSYQREDDYIFYGPGDGCQNGYLKQRIVDVGVSKRTTTYEYDCLGNVTRITSPEGNDWQYTLNALNQVVRTATPEIQTGSGVRYVQDRYYDAVGNVVRIDRQNVNDSGQLQTNTHWTTVFEYGILNELTHKCQEVEPYTTAIPGLAHTPSCASLPQAAFATTEYFYDTNRNATKVRKGEATNGNDPFNTVTTVFDERNLRYRVTRGEGSVIQSITQLDYDCNGRLAKESKGIGGVPRITVQEYDGFRRLKRRIDPVNTETAFNWSPRFEMTGWSLSGVGTVGGSQNVLLAESVVEYDEVGRVSARNVSHSFYGDPIGDGLQRSQFERSADNTLKSVEDDLGRVWRYAFEAGFLLSVVEDPQGSRVQFTYDAEGNRVSMTEIDTCDYDGREEQFTTHYVYDGLRRLVEQTDNVGNKTRYGYDSRNNRVRMLDALGRETRHYFDGMNRRIATAHDLDGDGASADDPDDIVTRQDWDDSSRLIAQIDDKGNATRYGYDSLDRRIVTRYADGTLDQIGTGAAWPDGAVRPDLFGFINGHDVLDNARRTSDANETSVISNFDAAGRLTSKLITPGPGVSSDTTSEFYDYDGMNRVIRAADNDSEVIRFFDSLGNMYLENLNGELVLMDYDSLGNKTLIHYPGAGPEPERIVNITYDSLNRKKTISDQDNQIATYWYCGQSRVDRREYGNGTYTDYRYDGVSGVANPPNDFAVKRVVGIVDAMIAGQFLEALDITWDAVGNKTSSNRYLFGISPLFFHRYEYDRVNRLIRTMVRRFQGFTPVVIRDTSYALDGVGNRIQVAGGPDEGSYGMSDASEEPADEQVNQYTTSPIGPLGYDENGNLTRIGAPDTNDDDVLSLADFVDFPDCQTGPAPAGLPEDCHRYDLDGDQDVDLQDYAYFQRSLGSSSLMEYDYKNRMVRYVNYGTPGERYEYRYDAFGRRIQKVHRVHSKAIPTWFFYDNAQLLEERTAFVPGGGPFTLATYVYGNYIDDVLATYREGALYFYHHDDQYNVRFLTHGGEPFFAERYVYGDYGQPLNLSDPTKEAETPSPLGNPLLFNGHYFDIESRQYNYRTRYLDPALGRFTTRDTIGTWGDVFSLGNALSAMGNNPSSSLDPIGTFRDDGSWGSPYPGGVAGGPGYADYGGGDGGIEGIDVWETWDDCPFGTFMTSNGCMLEWGEGGGGGGGGGGGLGACNAAAANACKDKAMDKWRRCRDSCGSFGWGSFIVYVASFFEGNPTGMHDHSNEISKSCETICDLTKDQEVCLCAVTHCPAAVDRWCQ